MYKTNISIPHIKKKEEKAPLFPVRHHLQMSLLVLFYMLL